VDLFIFTQLNLRTIEATMQVLGQPMSKTHWIMDKWGYTGSACIPMALDDVDLFVFTQLNLRTIEATMQVLDQPMSKTHWIMDKWGYTGSACIPMALDDAVENGKVKSGDVVLFCASGGGLAMAVAAFKWK